MKAIGVWLNLTVLGTGAAFGETPPQRIVSLNLCTDQLLLLLVEERRIAAVSFLARDATLSAMAKEAQGLRSVRGSAEEVLALDPDLVLASPWSTLASVAALRRLGRRVVIVTLAQDLDGIRHTLRELGREVGAEARAEALIAAFDARLAALRREPLARRPSAVVYHVAGLASGPGSLADAVLTAAGFENAARHARLDAKGALALERLVAAPPDLVVLGHTADEYRTVQADNLRHPALARLLARVKNVHVPQRLMICGTPKVVEAIEILHAARRELP